MIKIAYLVTTYVVAVGVAAWWGGWGPAVGVAIFGLIWMAYVLRHPRRPNRV
jgi:hypothetical protein